MSTLSTISDYSAAVESSFVSEFGGVGDGVTNNDTAFTNAEASGYERIWLAQGRFLTTKPASFFRKRYVGPGKVYFGTVNGSLSNFSRYSSDVPWFGTGTSYNESADIQFSEVEFKQINSGIRHEFTKSPSTGFPPYFYAPSTPQFVQFNQAGGSSGYAGVLAAAVAVGATVLQITGGTVGWAVGAKIGLTSGAAADGTIIETATIASVNTGAGTITLTAPITHAYVAGSVINFGYRTMNPYQLGIVNHTGGGDAYMWCARVIVSSPALASQPSFDNIATGGLIGGDITLTENGNYATGWEAQYIDTGKDVAVVGRVDSYIRTNNSGARNVMWLHDYAKMDVPNLTNNLKPIDGVWVAAMYAKTGLDLTRSVCSVAAIAVPTDQKIALNAQVSAPGPTNGNGFVATTTGGVYLWSSTDGAGRYAQLCNSSASLLLRPASLQVNVATDFGSNAVSAGSMTLSGSGSVGGNLTVGGTTTSLNLIATNSLGVAANKPLYLSGLGGNSYFIFDSSANVIALYKSGVQVAVW